MNAIIEEHEKPCPVCDKPGHRYPVEGIPRNGILWRVNHGGGLVHEWGEYKSVEDYRDRGRGRGRHPVDIMCPVCEREGIVNTFRYDKVRLPYKYSYRVSHSKKVSSRQFCYITKPEHRDVVLKVLGRYLGPDTTKKMATPPAAVVVPERKKEKKTTGKSTGRPLSKIPGTTREILEDEYAMKLERVRRLEKIVAQEKAGAKRIKKELDARP